MSKYHIEILFEAGQQLRDIAVYHREKVGPLSARQITDQILNEIDKLSDFPMLVLYRLLKWLRRPDTGC